MELDNRAKEILSLQVTEIVRDPPLGLGLNSLLQVSAFVGFRCDLDIDLNILDG